VIQCRVREVRRQEMVKDVVKCFGCEEEGHKKWECPRKEEAAPPREIWEKVKKYSRMRGLPPRGARMSMEGWTMQKEVVTFVECRGCDYKGTKTQENQGQGFLSKKQLLYMWCEGCKEAKEWREREAQGGRAERVVCSACDVRDTVCNKTAGKLEHLWRWIILFLFHFSLLCNTLKCVGHYDSKGVCRIIQVDKY